MGFEVKRSGMAGGATPRGHEYVCPLCKTVMKSGALTMIARLPQETHTEVRKVHVICVPVSSPNYAEALQLLGA